MDPQDASERPPQRPPQENSGDPRAGGAASDGPRAAGAAAADPTPSPSGRDRRLMASGGLALLWVTMPPLAGMYILYDLANIAAFLRSDLEHGFWAYVAVFAVTAGLGLLPTYSQAFLGGWVFGLKFGLLGAILGFTGGAAIGYLFSRVVTGGSIDAWIDRNPRGRVIRDSLSRESLGKTFLIVTLLRLPPSSPFALTNYALGATKVPFWLAMVATPIGMLPRTAIVVFLASAAVESGATDIMSVVDTTPTWYLVTGIGLSVAVVMVIGKLAERALARLTNGGARG